MSKFKMICLDIDGTLLNSEHRITEKTKNVIEVAANEKGIPVILVSARMPKGILFLQKELEITEPIICYSGSLIMDKGGKIILNKTIPISSLKQIYQLIKNMNIHMSLYKDDEWYIEEKDQWSEQESEITKIVPNVVEFSLLFEKWREEGTGPNKILCMAIPDKIDLLKTKIKDDKLNVYPSKSTYLEIMPTEASKTTSIEYLREKLGVNRSEIIAIGDNYNDMDMIEYAGLGIAMGNAPEQVKKCANEVTLSNDEDGVAESLKNHVIDKFVV